MITVRPAKIEELNALQTQLARRAKDGYEQFDIERSVVHVAEDTVDGLLAGMICARLRVSPISMAPCWHVEPLLLFPAFTRHSGQHSQRKATYLLAKAAENYITDPARNTTGVRAFFVFIENKNKPMHGLARHIGWKPVKGKLYAREA